MPKATWSFISNSRGSFQLQLLNNYSLKPHLNESYFKMTTDTLNIIKHSSYAECVTWKGEI